MTAPVLLPSALAIARLAAATYAPDTRPTIEVGSSEVYLTELPGGAVAVMVRGSTDGFDWMRNLRGLPVYAAELGCWVHSGFLACLREAAGPLMSELIDRGMPPIIAGGHSKGGIEVAFLTAWLLRHGYPHVLGLYTYGAPRGGYGGLVKRLASVPTWRHVNGGDRVPDLLSQRLLGYRHAGETIPIGRRKHPIEDHDISRYVAALERAAT